MVILMMMTMIRLIMTIVLMAMMTIITIMMLAMMVMSEPGKLLSCAVQRMDYNKILHWLCRVGHMCRMYDNTDMILDTTMLAGG